MKKARFTPHTLQNVIDFGFTEPSIEKKSPYPEIRTATASFDADRKLIRYLSFGSGSSGNASYVGSEEGGMLIDAGVKPEIILPALASNGLRMESVKGILLTHDHNDHVKYAYKLLRTYRHLHLFCTNRVLKGMMQRHKISKRIQDFHVPIYKEIPFRLLDFEITAFDVPHDGTDNMGFHLSLDDRSICIATDMGAISERAEYYMSKSNYLVIESNYDSEMLRLGHYPEYLKARIRTSLGHMDNNDTASFLARVMKKDIKYVFLCHLSQDNNTPEKAFETVRSTLVDAGYSVGTSEETLEDRKADVRLMVLPRFQPTRLFVFRD